jgi:serine/threonine protein kinase
VQIGKDPLPNDLKIQIALGIASGLEALHNHDMVHGDMKPENIIMFSDPQKTLVPKLGDFGFAVIEAAEATDVMLGGTRTWRAPESYYRLPTSMLRFTDVYSFGLVAWSIALDGMDPFSLLLPEHLQAEAHSMAIDQLKTEDNVFSLLAYEEWILEWEHFKKTRHTTTFPSELVKNGTETHTSLQIKHDSKPALCATLRQLPYYRSLESVLASTLSLHPEQRDLTMAINALKNDADANLAE